ncbi:MAG: helix-turn-helix domain-containing protein [Actinomycetota bacterium]|nr:helix-turn-helix domain-containing protein [Actinomycetota bacterium]
MALRRQRLSQRRKAVGLTQESLAQRLGVESSTVSRWEAGDTQPLPSIRPHVARALHVSVDQLAELLAESATAKTTRGLLAETEVTMPVPKAQAEVWLGRTEFQDLIHPQAAAAVETLQSTGVGTDNPAATALGPTLPELATDIAYPADTNTAATGFGSDTPVPATVGVGRFGGSDVPKPAQTNVSNFSSVTTIPLKVAVANVQRRRARSRRFKRLAAAGVLALMGGIASMPFITSGSGRIPPAAAGNPAPAAPVVAIPASEPSNNDNNPRGQNSTGASVAAPNDPADGLALSGQSAVSTPHSTQSPNRRISASQPPASMTAPPAPRTPAIPTEAYTWSGMDALSARDQSRAPLRPEAPPHP